LRASAIRRVRRSLMIAADGSEARGSSSAASILLFSVSRLLRVGLGVESMPLIIVSMSDDVACVNVPRAIVTLADDIASEWG